MGKIKDTVDGVFPLKTFCLSLALLVIALLLTVGIHQAFFAKPVEHSTLTGKTMAMLEIATKIEDQPIQTIVEDPKPVEPTMEEPPKPAVDETLETPSPEDAHHATPVDVPKVTEPEPTEMAIEDSIAGLSEETPFGYLPVVRDSDGLRSFDAYKTPFKLKADTKGVISLVMVDYGLSDKLARDAIAKLPAATTFVASPYADNLQAKVTGARSHGMEVWMGIPMQGTENSAPTNMGPNAILTGLNTKENLMRLNTHLGRATGYAGVAFAVKPTYAEDAPELKSLINTLSTRGLGVAQLDPTDKLIGHSAEQTNAPYVGGNIWIDTVLTKSAILAALAEAEKKSLAGGNAVVAFHPSMLTHSVIAEWQTSLTGQHIQLAPLTYAVHISRDSSSDKQAAPAADKTETEKQPHVSH